MTVLILLGDVMTQLARMEPESVDCVVTSPPYWGLRDYDVIGQIGLEPTLTKHLAVMVAVFRAIRRVLKPHGTLWINYGDCYASTPAGRSPAATKAAGNDDRTFRDKPFSTIQGLMKAKDLCLVPQRLFIALQEDGWWVRSILPWIKSNPLPESSRDRPGNGLEFVGMLTKSSRYYYDRDAVMLKASARTHARVAQDVAAQAGSARANGGSRSERPMKAVFSTPKTAPDRASGVRANATFEAVTSGAVVPYRGFRNTDPFYSSVEDLRGLIVAADDDTPVAIDVGPKGFKGAHFATFPEGLVRPLIMASCPPGGRVLDPFGGAGTTALVAERLGRDSTLIELNPKYAVMAMHRIAHALPEADIEMGGA